MKKVDETKKLIIYKEVEGKKQTVYRQHKEDESKEKVKIYEKEGSTYTFEFDGIVIKKIVLKDTKQIPDILSKYGYGFDDNTLNIFFRKNFNDPQINSLILSAREKSKKKDGALVINLDDLNSLLQDTRQEQRACNDTKRILIKNFLVNICPDLAFDYQETNNNKSLVIRNLNKKLIAQLNADEIEKIGDFYIEATQKYSRADYVKRMTIGLQKNSKLLALQGIIKEYEKLLKDDPAEGVWQNFFDEYITLFDTRYAHKLDYKNIAVGITKYPDLVLVDIYGYIDFYELKKCSTPLMKYDSSHKTWYWSKEVSMVISQASDYLRKAKENAISYASTIKEYTATESYNGMDVNIINPKAIIVAGNTKDLNSKAKKNQFKNLRESLKDIEFILYDELLDRLKNLLETIKEK